MKEDDRHEPLPCPVLLLLSFQRVKAVTPGAPWNKAEAAGPVCWGPCLLGRCQDRQATGCPLEAGTTLAWQRGENRL